MGSGGNSNPWFQYQTYRDCSQGFCSIYCPQWCYIIFPPPPPSAIGGSSNSSSPFDFSPLIVAVIGILVSAFIIIGYFTFISKYFRRNTAGNNNGNGAADSDDQISSESYQASSSSGLDEALIKSITVWKYKKNDGFVEEADHCSVCLSEFEENESLRILPKCSHPFHLPCIDTWLMSNSTCPLCRSTISPTNILPISAQQTQPSGLNLSALDSQSRINNKTVLMVQNFEEAIVVEAGSYGSPKHSRGRVYAERQSSEQRESIIEIREDGFGFPFQFQPFRRSVSMTSCSSYPHPRASVDDTFRATYNGERVEQEERRNLQMGIGSSRGNEEEEEDGRFNNRRGDLNLAMKRSISAGKVLFTKE